MVRFSHLTIGFLVPIILLFMISCDPDQESPDYATISGRVYTDSTMTQGVSGVEIIVESDLGSETPYTGPDQFGNTDHDGNFSVSFYLGHTVATDGTITHTYIADCKVSYWYQGHSFSWDSGITVASGKDYILPNVHLGQFQ
jgi:hypothetical protein